VDRITDAVHDLARGLRELGDLRDDLAYGGAAPMPAALPLPPVVLEGLRLHMEAWEGALHAGAGLAPTQPPATLPPSGPVPATDLMGPHTPHVDPVPTTPSRSRGVSPYRERDDSIGTPSGRPHASPSEGADPRSDRRDPRIRPPAGPMPAATDPLAGPDGPNVDSVPSTTSRSTGASPCRDRDDSIGTPLGCPHASLPEGANPCTDRHDPRPRGGDPTPPPLVHTPRSVTAPTLPTPAPHGQQPPRRRRKMKGNRQRHDAHERDTDQPPADGAPSKPLDPPSQAAAPPAPAPHSPSEEISQGPPLGPSPSSSSGGANPCLICHVEDGVGLLCDSCRSCWHAGCLGNETTALPSFCKQKVGEQLILIQPPHCGFSDSKQQGPLTAYACGCIRTRLVLDSNSQDCGWNQIAGGRTGTLRQVPLTSQLTYCKQQ